VGVDKRSGDLWSELQQGFLIAFFNRQIFIIISCFVYVSILPFINKLITRGNSCSMNKNKH